MASYDVTPAVTIDLPTAIWISAMPAAASRTNYLGGTSPGLEIEDITSQDVMLGVRWKLGSAPAPMPVAFK